MRILLVKSRSLASKVSGSTPPLGLMYLSAYVKRHLPVQTRILDLKFERDPRRGVADAVTSWRPDVVGLSALTAEAFMLHEAARIVRAADPTVPIVAGGPHATSDPADTLADGAVDVAVLGEGEQTFTELVRLIREQGPGWHADANLADVAGLAWRTARGEVRRSAPRPFLADLDSLPFPDWDAVDLTRFWNRPSMATVGVRPYMTMFTSRGCPYRCTYCHNLFGKRFRARSPENVVAEVQEIVRRYGPIDLEVLDDIANLKRERLDAILQGLLDRDLHPRISFPNGVRTDLLETGTIDLLTRVGAGEISIAVETASPRLQKLIRKNLDLERVRATIHHLAERRVFTRGFFMLGFPTETASEILATIRFAVRSPLHLALFFAVNPFKDTELAKTARGPEGCDDVSSARFEYFGAPFNQSDVPDEVFRQLYRYAYYRFYGDPFRVARILRDRPYLGDLPPRFKLFFTNITSFREVDETRVTTQDPDAW